jgi:23S rRNA (uracil1939-C5)-methyltransferase
MRNNRSRGPNKRFSNNAKGKKGFNKKKQSDKRGGSFSSNRRNNSDNDRNNSSRREEGADKHGGSYSSNRRSNSDNQDRNNSSRREEGADKRGGSYSSNRRSNYDNQDRNNSSRRDERGGSYSSNRRSNSDNQDRNNSSRRDERGGSYSSNRRSNYDNQDRNNSPRRDERIDKRGQNKNKKRKIGAKPKEMIATNWSAKGEAVVFDGNKRILIWSGIPTEKAIVQLTHRGQNQSYGHFVETSSPSPYRQEPTCKRYDRCGGCPLMHMNEEGQHAAKLQMFTEHFQGTDLDDLLPKTVITKGSQNEYRYVSKLVAGKANHGAFRLGARNRDGQIVPIPDCLVSTPELNEIGKQINYLAMEEKIFPYTSEKPSGLRYVVMRQSKSTEQVLITIVATQRTRYIEKFAERIILLPFNISGVMLHVNNEIGNAIFARDDEGGVRYQKLEGSAKITENIGGIHYELGPGDFFQVNPFVAEQLQTDVIQESKEFIGHPMVDLYSGVGFFTNALAKEHSWAMGIEGNSTAVKRAKQAASINKLMVKFREGEVIEELFDLQEELQGASPCFIVDPARRGLEDGVIDEILSQNPAGIIYVSCSPRTLVRDIQILQEKKWTVQKIQVYDMFPQTIHLEALAVLRPPKGTKLLTRRPPRRVIIR